MIRLEEVIHVPTQIDDAFAYVADFGTIADWDPGVVESERLDSGPLGVGSRFRVVTEFRGRRTPMTYEITSYEPPVRVVLTGDGSTVGAVDTISFDPGSEGTEISYEAELSPKGILRIAAPLMGRVFDRIGKDAVAGLEHELRSRSVDETTER